MSYFRPYTILDFLVWIPILWTSGNIADSVQMPQNAASGQGLHCLHTGVLGKKKIRKK